jgi:hypothetical protein
MELDFTWMAIWTLKKVGLVKNIRVAKVKRSTNATSIDSAFEGEMVKQAA